MFETPPSATREEFAALLRLAGPLVLANLLQMAVWSVDVMFVARLGPEAIAAASLATSLAALTTWSFASMASAVAPLIAAELGRRRHAVREVRRSMRMALWLALALGAIGVALLGAGHRVLALTGQDPRVAARAGAFLAVARWALPPMIVSAVLRTFVSALGRPLFATAITALAIGINILGNYAFVFGHFGAPALGLTGSAAASTITASAMVIAYAVAIGADRRLRRYYLLGRFWRPEWRRLGELLRIGLPIACTVIAEGGLFGSAAFLMGRLGETELAGHTLALQIAAIAFQVPFGVGQAATIRVGYAYGARQAGAIGRAGTVALASGLGFALVSSAAMILVPRWLLSAYIDVAAPANAAMVMLAVRFLAIAAAFQLADAAQAIGAGALRGLQDTRVPMAIAIGGYWLPGFGTAALLGLATPLRGTGVWLGLASGLACVAAGLLWRWARRERIGLLPEAPGPV